MIPAVASRRLCGAANLLITVRTGGEGVKVTTRLGVEQEQEAIRHFLRCRSRMSQHVPAATRRWQLMRVSRLRCVHRRHVRRNDRPSETALDVLQQRNAELTAAVAARDTFIAVAAHELRNPMTPMIGQIDLLLRGLRAGRYTPEQIEQRLERVQLMMNQYLERAATLLDVSRITTGKLTLAPAPFDLSDLVRETVQTFAAAARHAGARDQRQCSCQPSRHLGLAGNEQILSTIYFPMPSNIALTDRS